MEGGCTLLWRLSRVSEILQPPPLERWERGQMACRQVTTSDGEFFPVKARLLRPCLALTSAVQVRCCCCCCLRRCLGASRRFPFRTCAPTTAPSRRANQTLVPDATQFYFIFIFILKFKKVLSCNDREHNCLRLVCPPWRLYLSHVYVSRLPACPLLGSGGPRRARACDPEVHRGPGLLHFRPRPALPRGARGGEAL
jgi:hypothetical protein